MQYLMGIDNGGTFVKAAIFDLDGKQIAVHAETTPAHYFDGCFAERDMENLWQTNCSVIKQVLEKSQIPATAIAALSFSGHGKGLYLLDEKGQAVRPGIMSTDSRAEALVNAWVQNGVAEQVYHKTLQKVLASQAPALLAWLKRYEPDCYDSIAAILSVKDFIRYKLTDEIFAEFTDSSGNSLVNLETRAYDDEILPLFGLSELQSTLPKLISSFDHAGKITPLAASLTGLNEGTPVVAGMFDINVCGLASGLVNEDELAVIAGTWSINEYISKTPIRDGSIALNSLYCIPGYYLLEESSATSAGNLEWYIRNILNFDGDSKSKSGHYNYADVNAMVDSLDPRESSLIFFPFINGSADTGFAKASFIGMDPSTDLRQMLRAIYEGVVFTHKAHIDKLLKNRARPERLRLSGGASRSIVWVQIFADVLQIPIEVVEDKELGCHGAAMAAGVALGLYESYEEAVSRSVVISKRVEPRAVYASVYEEKYARYMQLRDLLNEFWLATSDGPT